MRIFMSKEDREIKDMCKCEARVEIDKMITRKRPGSGFSVADGSSQRFWKLKEKIGEGVDTL